MLRLEDEDVDEDDVDEWVGVGVLEWVAVGFGLLVGVLVCVGSEDAVCVADGEGVGLSVCVALGEGEATSGFGAVTVAVGVPGNSVVSRCVNLTLSVKRLGVMATGLVAGRCVSALSVA